jgi:hypothetical protein
MMTFDREVVVYVTANSTTLRGLWVSRFVAFFVNSTVTEGVGTWTNTQGDVMDEPVTLVSHLYQSHDPDYRATELAELVREYKAHARQEAVLVVVRQLEAHLN